MKKILLVGIPILIIGIGITLFFIFKENIYTVTFDTNGGSTIQSIQVKENTKIDLEEPSKEGYIFDGWYLDNEKIISPYTVTSDITLTAKYYPEPFYIDEELYKKGALLDDIDSETLTNMEENKESFVLFVYAPGCTACAAFREVLKDFISENKITFYVMPTPESKETDIYEHVKYAPTIVIFKDGEIVSYLDALSDEDTKYYESSDNFKEWLQKYIILK